MSKGTADVTVTDKYVFFWRGYLGQWFRSYFVLDGIKYSHAEQAMMYKKAELFNDHYTAKLILQSDRPSDQQKLGREVRNFNRGIWDNQCVDIVARVNVAKFSQDSELKEQFLSTGDRIFVEASPKDSIWGIGLPVSNSDVNDPVKWRGKNLLGIALGKARDEIRGGNLILK